MEHKLFYLLEPYGDEWAEPSDSRNDEAEKVLRKFYVELYKCKTDRKYAVSNHISSHTSYITNLIRIYSSLQERNYLVTCNEICTLIHFEPFLQARIKNNLIEILENHFIKLNSILKIINNKEDKTMEKVNKIDSIMVAYINGKAIYVDDENKVYYIKMDKEFAVLGSTAYDDDLISIDELSQVEKDKIIHELESY